MTNPDIFQERLERSRTQTAPLADRMRPRTLDQYVGQQHILGPGKLLRRAIEADRIGSTILAGPPGTGKTTLARVIARHTQAYFASLNAVLAGVKDIREVIAAAEDRLRYHEQRTILFVDEVHRFNSAQQDALLPHVENGTVRLIGATTENPYFEVNKALVSRSRIFVLEPLSTADLEAVLDSAVVDPDRGYGRRSIRLLPEARNHLAHVANGDARSALNALELAVETTAPSADNAIEITLRVAEESIQQRAVLYDREGDAHFDSISAFIKSVRGSDPDAALYWLARMIYAGEDPQFLIRRMIILASEDIGMADPLAQVVAASAAQAFAYVGMPEGQYILANCCLYLATAPKSNSTLAYFDARKAVEEEQTGDIPNHLKDASRDGKALGHGKGYKYPHAYREGYVPQQYLPDNLLGSHFYVPREVGFEKVVSERLARLRAQTDE